MPISKNKKILVTGATGFIGKALVSKLVGSNYQATGLSLKEGKIGKIKVFALDLLKKDQLKSFFGKNQFDIIVHLAARVPQTSSLVEQKLALKENISSTLNLLEEFAHSGIQKFIYASGVSVLGTPKSDLAVDELTTAKPESLYTASKFFGEILCEQYGRKTNKDIVILRISAPYGPGQNPNNVIPLFLKSALSGRDIAIYGSGKRQQNFIYIDDVTRAILAAIKQKCSGIYNIGAVRSTNTLDLAKIILKNIPQSKSKIVFSFQDDPQENYRLKVNINKAQKELKFYPKVDIETGIKKYINFLKKQ